MKTTILMSGIFLIIMGLVGYFVLGAESVTALIPTFWGLPLLSLYLIGQYDERLKKTTRIVGLVLMLLGAGGSIGGIFKVIQFLSGETLARPGATLMQSLMFIICINYIRMAIKELRQRRT
ncbi:MAG: hypothetical protein ACO36I_09105 [Candidatus Latescibacterota bacterium]|jgi:hypothetical protein